MRIVRQAPSFVLRDGPHTRTVPGAGRSPFTRRSPVSAATALSAPALAAAHRQFEGALPAMTEAIRFHARRWPRRLRGDAVEAARAACWLAWRGLLARGRDPLTVGVTAIAFNACRYVRNGRRLGCGTPGRATDVLDPQVCRRQGLRIVALDEVEAGD